MILSLFALSMEELLFFAATGLVRDILMASSAIKICDSKSAIGSRGALHSRIPCKEMKMIINDKSSMNRRAIHVFTH